MARMTKAEILSLTPEQIEHLRRYDVTKLKQITSDLQAINRKSYMRLKAKGINSPFVKSYEKAGGQMSLRGLASGKGKSDQQLRMEATKVKNEFETQLSHLKAQTRTMKGAQKVYSEMRSKIDPEGNKLPENIREMSTEDVGKFWDVYHKMAEKHPSMKSDGSQGSPPGSVSEMIWNNIDPIENVDDIFKKVDEEYNEWYKTKELESQEDYSPNPYTISGEIE